MTSFQRTRWLAIALALACSSRPSPEGRAAVSPAAVPPAAQSGPSEDKQCEVLFARVDANSDDKISEAEFSTPPHPEQEDTQSTFVLRDQSQDGTLSKAEFCAPARVALR